MVILIKCGLLLLLSLTGYCEDRFYRFDYTWSDKAVGWLKYHAVPSTWERARMRCHAEGAVLASPLNEELKSGLVSFVQKQINSNHEQGATIFTGVHATFSDGDYSSVEGVPLLRLAVTWEAGEPDNFEDSERCLAMMIGYNGTMADTRCDRVLPYVCYKRDAELGVTECGTTDRGYVLEHRTGSCYKLHERSLPWSEAYMTCVAEGGYLAIINDDVEVKVIKDIISKRPPKYYTQNHGVWTVGFHDWGHYAASFMTIHGELLEDNYHEWGSGEPNNCTSPQTGDFHQSCGAIKKDGRLDDSYCNLPYEFVCEMTPLSLV